MIKKDKLNENHVEVKINLNRNIVFPSCFPSILVPPHLNPILLKKV